ncbi:family 76 putative glycoside hydrolase [Triangularia verruculosa]|uniref:Family 76 putative glycoside hydrolase n=1 Tax=Triangularia verruculosa TaxID=2587418 RepID=A0AAN7AYV7_9PEZI|nr:family 76 putative glycoside hydrolase [Triangularia verruculosa]
MRVPPSVVVVVALASVANAATTKVHYDSLFNLSSTDATTTTAPGASRPDPQLFADLCASINVMQNHYFENWIGTWPDAIDWTRAVMGTHIAGALRTITEDFELARSQPNLVIPPLANFIGRYFGELIAFYFGQDVFSLRGQAFDDMLWVVLGWLEAIQFIDELGDGRWHGERWTAPFAHRARIFWELSSKGWDQKLCGGGMLWNPRLSPYKNAITNELWIAASVGMYLHFPGDENTSPWETMAALEKRGVGKRDWPPHDPMFFTTAQRGYEWLDSSGMINNQGLYTDGFHISGYSEGSNNTKCDERDEMVYTYNQGVILSGQLGLFAATGSEEYLNSGHKLIKDVIRATGWDLDRARPVVNLDDYHANLLPSWKGLGRAGVLEEACDIFGTCSQDAQTFKGIWMHHFTTFCSPNSLDKLMPIVGFKLGRDGLARIKTKHFAECKKYVPWLRHNAAAALGTRDEHGKYGMWWTIGLFPWQQGLKMSWEDLELSVLPPDHGEDDYRNRGVPHNEVWMVVNPDITSPTEEENELPAQHISLQRQKVAYMQMGKEDMRKRELRPAPQKEAWNNDPNTRGRGRTVETQGGAVALLRALWVVSKHTY